MSRNKKFLIAFAIAYIFLRGIIFFNFQNHYMGGDAITYEKLALSEKLITPSKYLDVPDTYLYKIRNYERSDVFPYSVISRDQYWEPGYPFILSLIFKINKSRDFARFIQHIIMLLTFLIWFKILSPWLTDKHIYIYAVFFLIHPFFLAFPQLIYTETLDAFLISLNYLFYVKQHKKLRDYLLWGFALGFLTITESYYLPFSMGIIVFELWTKKKAKTILALTFTFSLTLAPVFYNNYLYTDGAFILATKSSNNIWVSNNNLPIMRDQAPWPVPKDYFQKKDKYPDVRPPCQTSLQYQNKCEILNAFEFIIDDPVRFLKRAKEKISNLWSPHIFPFNYYFNKIALGLNNTASNFLYKSFMILDIGIILIFFFSLCLLIFQKKSDLQKAIIAHLVFFHFIISIGHGLIRFKHGMMPIVVATILLAMNYQSKTLLKNKLFVSFTFIVLLSVSYSIYVKLALYWH